MNKTIPTFREYLNEQSFKDNLKSNIKGMVKVAADAAIMDLPGGPLIKSGINSISKKKTPASIVRYTNNETKAFALFYEAMSSKRTHHPFAAQMKLYIETGRSSQMETLLASYTINRQTRKTALDTLNETYNTLPSVIPYSVVDFSNIKWREIKLERI